MNKVNLAEILGKILSDLGLSIPPSQDTNFLEVGMDSILFLQFVMSIEDTFNCEIPDSQLEFETFNTINKVISYLSNNG